MSTLVAVYTTRAGQTSTHFACSLAWTLAGRSSVLLVDADMEGGTIADLLVLPVGDRGILNCFGEKPVSPQHFMTQAVVHPRRGGLRIIPGLVRSFGLDAVDSLRLLEPALRACADDYVVVDLGHPLSHPGLRSPRLAAAAISQAFARVFIVVRDEPALLVRTINVLSAAQPAHGELLLCGPRGRAYRDAVTDSLAQAVPELPVRDVWRWDAEAARRLAETGEPATIPGLAEDLALPLAAVAT
ncbi:MAG: MinD/ParA family ATP-binding protein [Candidatus Dormibacteria bacterium]